MQRPVCPLPFKMKVNGFYYVLQTYRGAHLHISHSLESCESLFNLLAGFAESFVPAEPLFDPVARHRQATERDAQSLGQGRQPLCRPFSRFVIWQ
jgi:hypothetical protein